MMILSQCVPWEGKTGMKTSPNFLALSAAFLLAVSVGAVSSSAITPDEIKIEDNKVSVPLSDKPGDPQAGRKWFTNRKLGNCLACHANKELASHPFHGEIGPPMDGVAERYQAAELRAILVDSKAVFGPETIMPSFYRTKTGARTLKKFQGKTILNGQQIEDIIAYLLTLKQ
ncbi:MAG: sulfur oxidation c-type cytochrome SoxX [Methyloligellaceae bacterium]